jgi:hypothetical protein
MAMTNSDDSKPQPETRRRQSTNTSWGPVIPIILLATIIFAITNRRGSDASEREILSTESTFDDTAILSGVTRKVSSSTFRHGEAEAFLGGVNLDLRDAMIEGDEARLDVIAIMGGVEIRVPQTWTVDSRVVPVLGGVENRTRSMNPTKRLVIEGTVLMGGLNIRN